MRGIASTDCLPAGIPTLLLVAGSQRAQSFNARLLADFAQRLQGRCRIDLLGPADIDLPLFNQDLEAVPEVLARVSALHRRFAASHALVVASPEYNGQLPPVLKNLIDWVSRLAWIDAGHTNPFVDRPVLLCSASTGSSGGALAIPHARALFGYVGCLVIGDSVSVPHADQAWTGDGYAFAPWFEAQIEGALGRVLRLAVDCARGLAAAATAATAPKDIA
jgi:NAD(P)H-dependent FMN reductase